MRFVARFRPAPVRDFVKDICTNILSKNVERVYYSTKTGGIYTLVHYDKRVELYLLGSEVWIKISGLKQDLQKNERKLLYKCIKAYHKATLRKMG